MTWLATIAAIAPFIGLFGTVMGIIDAFHGLGTAGAATLRAVAPGISEALITTAAGLVVAIPAVIGYNQLTARLREFGARMDDFGRELLNAIENAAMLTPPPHLRPQRRRRSRAGGPSSHGLLHRRGRTQTALAEINITPLVDVVLVLLLIFMLTAPVLQSGIEVAIPKTRTVNQLTEERMVVTIDKRAERLPAGQARQRQRASRAAEADVGNGTPPSASSTSAPTSAFPSAPSPR